MTRALAVFSFFPAFCLDFVECSFKIKCKNERVEGRLSGEQKHIQPVEEVRKGHVEPSMKGKERNCKY